MMLLIASEDLLTLFLTLETMTICLYLCTAFEKGRRRSAEAGLKYFIYGSVSSALFLFGLSLIYGLTGTHAVRRRSAQVMKPEYAGLSGLSGNVAGGDGPPARAGRLRVQDRGRAVPPVGARCL